MSSQSRIDIPSFVKQAEMAQAFDPSIDGRPFERRATPRKATDAKLSRYRGRALEFFGILAAIMVMVSAAGELVDASLGTTMVHVEAGLGRGPAT